MFIELDFNQIQLKVKREADAFIPLISAVLRKLA